MGRYIVWEPNNGQTEADGKKISAFDAGLAVAEWAEWSDSSSAEYHIVGGQAATVMVLDLDSTNPPREWVVSGESIPHYTGRLQPANDRIEPVTPVQEQQ